MSDKAEAKLSVVPSSHEPIIAGVSPSSVGPELAVVDARGVERKVRFRRIRIFERQKIDRARDEARAWIRAKYKGFDNGENRSNLFEGSFAYRVHVMIAPYITGAWSGEGNPPSTDDLMDFYDDDLDRMAREIRRLNPVGARDIIPISRDPITGVEDPAPGASPGDQSGPLEVERPDGSTLSLRVRRLSVGERLAVSRARDEARTWLNLKYPGYESQENRDKLFEASDAFDIYSVAAPYLGAAYVGDGPAPKADDLLEWWPEDLNMVMKEIRRFNPTAIDLPDPKE